MLKKTNRVPKPPFILREDDKPHLEQLPERFQMPLKLAHQGTSVEKIAAALALPSGTVKSRIHRARGAIERMRKGEKPLIASGRT